MSADAHHLLLPSYRVEVAPTFMDDFEAFASVRWPGLVRTAYLMGCSPADAEDCAQTALTAMWRSWPRVLGAQNPEAYAFRILINTVRRSQRRRWGGEKPVGDPVGGDDPGPDLGDPDAAIDLRGALRTLPPDQRAVIVLRFLHDKSEAEIGAILDIPAGTVKSRSARGIRALRAHMNQEPPS